MNPLNYRSECFCPECGKETVDCIDMYGNSINFPLIIKTNNMERLHEIHDRVSLSHMECTSCHTRYVINWCFGVPRPFYYDPDLNTFKNKEL